MLQERRLLTMFTSVRMRVTTTSNRSRRIVVLYGACGRRALSKTLMPMQRK